MPERTIRQEIMALIVDSTMTAKDLSQIIRISEKEVYPHLEHIAKSLRNDKEKRLVIEPSRCYQCGFIFKERRRLTSPSRCPRCRHEGISPPVFSIAKINRSSV
ncbi:MAG: transcriptional regulator [Nitrospirae bacterium]|nr:transcriptional regulator [Nitrospirota bacterium]